MVVNPVLSANQAEERAQSAVGGGLNEPSLPQFQLESEHGFHDPHVMVIFPNTPRPVLAWGVLVRTPPQRAWRVYIDATNGTPIGYQVVAAEWPR
jgi:hypothetical protein